MALQKDKKSRAWLTVVYPESCPSDWIDLLTEIGCQALISPLHEFDVNADGEIKKAHWHVILIWDGPTTYANASSIVNSIGGVGCICCVTLRGAARYLCHLDNPDKFQYSIDFVRSIGGLNYKELINSATDDELALWDILYYVYDHKIVYYASFLMWCRTERPDWASLIVRKERQNVIEFMKSLEYELNRGVSNMFWQKK